MHVGVAAKQQIMVPAQFRLQTTGLRCLKAALSRPSSTVAAASQQTARNELELKPFSSIPGPKPLPVVGNLFELRRNINGLQDYYGECFKKYGDIFKYQVPGTTTVVFKDPKSLEKVLRAEGKYPQRDILFLSRYKWFFEKGIKLPCPTGFEYGTEWKRKRTAIGKQTLPRNVFSYIPGLNDIVCRFTDFLRSSRDEQGRVDDIADLIKMLLIELSGKLVYGADIQAVSQPTEEGTALVDSITTLTNVMVQFAVVPPLYKLYPTKLYRDIVTAYQTLFDIGSKYANEVIKRVEAGEESEVQGLLEQWLRDGKLTKEEYMSQSFDMFGAGVDSTVNQTVFMMFEVAKRQEVQEKLYAEIKSVLGDSKHPTAEHLAAMPYLKGCVMESFRVRPTLHSSNSRVLNKDTTLLGYHIPADTQILYSNYEAGQNEDIFPNPEKFDPNRWARDDEDRSAFAVLPFGFGPRACFGKRFAEMEMKLILIQMVRNFKMRTYADDMLTAEGTFTRPGAKVPLKLMKRSIT